MKKLFAVAVLALALSTTGCATVAAEGFKSAKALGSTIGQEFNRLKKVAVTKLEENQVQMDKNPFYKPSDSPMKRPMSKKAKRVTKRK